MRFTAKAQRTLSVSRFAKRVIAVVVNLLRRRVPRYRLWQAFYLGFVWGLVVYFLVGS